MSQVEDIKPDALQIPTVDISSFLSPGSATDEQFTLKSSAAARIFKASSSYGFLYVSASSLFPPGYLGNVIRQAKAFFDLPAAVKEAILLNSVSEGLTRGYIKVGGESGSSRLEVKEAFSYGYDWEGKNRPPSFNSLQGDNCWPDQKWVENFRVAEWKRTMIDLYEKLCFVALGITRSLALALGKEECFFEEYCDGGDTISLMRLFHYFPIGEAQSIPFDGERIGSSPHTDWGFLTLIAQQATVTGLRAYVEGVWREVSPVEDALLVNCGDYLSLLTGGKFKSPLHRVDLSQIHRYSAVFFYYPSYHSKIPLLTDTSDEVWNSLNNYSLFEDQGQTRSDGQEVSTPRKLTTLEQARSLTKTTFGDYIARKWRQVHREEDMTT